MMKSEKKFYMTVQGHKKLCDERDHLMYKERPEVTKVVAWAAGNGDRSENADYIYGKKRLREIDKRLRFLASRLDHSQVINPEVIQSQKVQFGATVKVLFESGEEKIFRIVGIDEINPEQGKISYQSPIGKAILGKEEGDTVEFRSPKGQQELEILEVSYIRIPEGEA